MLSIVSISSGNRQKRDNARLHRFAAAVVLILCVCVRLSALDNSKTLTQYAHRIWGQEEGLFQPTIYSILQTHDGVLWLGTQDSLIRFDGVNFREFDDAAQSVFHRSLIHALMEDRAGNLWVGSLGSGIARIDSQGAVHSLTVRNGLPSDSAFCLASDNKDNVWVCTNAGLARFDGHTFKVFTTADGLPSNQVRSTCTTPAGERWVAGLDFGLSRWNGSRFAQVSDHVLPRRETVTSLACAGDGSVWAGTANGLTQITAHGSRTLTVQNGLPDDQVSSLAASSDGSLWIGTNDGISRYRNGEISVYRTRDGLSHSVVLSLYMDREGSLWAGTKDGLDQFTDGKVTPYTTNEGLATNEVGPVLEDVAGRLWIGTFGHGLESFDGRRFRSLTTKDGLIDDTILSLQLDRSGGLWVGTRKGINLLKDGKVIRSYTVRDGLSAAEVRALFVDANGVVWAGTEKGLDRLEDSRFVESSLVGLHDHAGVVALAGGLTVPLVVSTEASEFFLLRNNTSRTYPLDVIHSVDCYYFDSVRRTAWMGTLGSALLRLKNGTLTHIRVRDGLYDNRIYSILRDDASNFWLASSKGIFRVSQDDLEKFADRKIRSFNSIPFSTGQLRFECTPGVQPAACRTRDGRLWFSTTGGLVVVDPHHLQSNGVPPPVAINAILVNGQRFSPHQHLRLKPWDKNNVEIRYAGLSFVAPEKVSFRYLLEGYDKTWTDAGSRREAFFTNLPPGNFRFRVLARNADGVWSKEPATLDFTVEPRLYQRAWFFPIVALALAAAIACGYRVRIRQLKHRFDLVLNERSRIARELHDTLLQGLNGITMQLQALLTRLPASREKQVLAEIIGDAGRCSAEARQSLWGLRTIGPGSMRFSEKLAALASHAVSGTDISIELHLEPVSLSSSPEIEYQLLRIAQEAISNTVAHARAKRLEIRLEILDRRLELELNDNGTGFSAGHRAVQGHFGMEGMRERAAEIGAEFAIDSTPGQGTRVMVRVPLGTANPTGSNAEHPFEHQLQ